MANTSKFTPVADHEKIVHHNIEVRRHYGLSDLEIGKVYLKLKTPEEFEAWGLNCPESFAPVVNQKEVRFEAVLAAFNDALDNPKIVLVKEVLASLKTTNGTLRAYRKNSPELDRIVTALKDKNGRLYAKSPNVRHTEEGRAKAYKLGNQTLNAAIRNQVQLEGKELGAAMNRSKSWLVTRAKSGDKRAVDLHLRWLAHHQNMADQSAYKKGHEYLDNGGRCGLTHLNRTICRAPKWLESKVKAGDIRAIELYTRWKEVTGKKSEITL